MKSISNLLERSLDRDRFDFFDLDLDLLERFDLDLDLDLLFFDLELDLLEREVDLLRLLLSLLLDLTNNTLEMKSAIHKETSHCRRAQPRTPVKSVITQ